MVIRGSLWFCLFHYLPGLVLWILAALLTLLFFELTTGVILVSGIKCNPWVFVYTAKWSPQEDLFSFLPSLPSSPSSYFLPPWKSLPSRLPRWDAARFMNRFIKPITSSNSFGWNLCVSSTGKGYIFCRGDTYGLEHTHIYHSSSLQICPGLYFFCAKLRVWPGISGELWPALLSP